MVSLLEAGNFFLNAPRLEDTHPFQIRLRSGQLRYYKNTTSLLRYIRKQLKRRKPKVTAISWGYLDPPKDAASSKDAASPFDKPSSPFDKPSWIYQKWILYGHFDEKHGTIPPEVTQNIEIVPCFVLYLPIKRPVKFLTLFEFSRYIRDCEQQIPKH